MRGPKEPMPRKLMKPDGKTLKRLLSYIFKYKGFAADYPLQILSVST